MASTAKIIFAVSGIFLAGAVTGGFVSLRVASSISEKRITPDRFGPAQMERLAQRLDLTDEQLEKIRPIINQTAENVNKTRRDTFKATADLIDRMDAEVAKVLTAEQRERLAAMRAEENERRKQWMAERARRNEGRPPGPGGPDGPPPPRSDRPREP